MHFLTTSFWGVDVDGDEKFCFVWKTGLCECVLLRYRAHLFLSDQKFLYLIPRSQSQISHFQESKASSHIMVIWESKHQISLLYSFLPPNFIAENHLIQYKLVLWSVRVSCPSSVLAQHLDPCQHICWGRSMKKRTGIEGMNFCKHY